MIANKLIMTKDGLEDYYRRFGHVESLCKNSVKMDDDQKEHRMQVRQDIIERRQTEPDFISWIIILPRLLLGRQAFVPDGVSINGRFEAERHPASTGSLSGGRTAIFIPYV